MNTHAVRIELLIDIFEQQDQRAQALPTLTPAELVAAVLQEFRELEYLGANPADYLLVNAGDGQPLDGATPIGQQLRGGERLALLEVQPVLPEGTQRPGRAIYLREQTTGTVYRLPWQPALIGRPDESQAHHERLAVDLSAHSAGLRVSRRHAQLIEAGGQFYLEPLAQNPTAIRDNQGAIKALGPGRQPLHHGDTIVLERSQIELKVIVRDEEPS